MRINVSKQLTWDEAEAVLKAHEKAEMDVDYDATIATIVDDPVYELPTLGYMLEGAEAVHEFYRRTLPYFAKFDVYADVRVHALSKDGTVLAREAYPYITVDGEKVQCNYSTIVVLEGDKIKSERLYVDPVFGSYFAESLGEDFEQVPGVIVMPWLKHQREREALASA